MKFEKDLTEFIHSLTKENIKKPIEKKSGIPSKYILSKEEGIIPVRDAFITPGEISEDNNLPKPQYWSNEIEETSNMDSSNKCIIKKEE